MVISLIGIVVIQSNLIMGSIEEKENAFALHVNDALNNVNETIELEEAEFFLREEFGGVDSMLHDIIREEIHGPELIEDIGIITEDDSDNNTIIIESDPDGEHTQIKIQYSEESSGSETERHQITIDNNWAELIDLKMEEIDSALEAHIIFGEEKENKLDHISSLVQHFTFETTLSEELEDRISETELEEKIKLALQEEGLDTLFEFAVFDDHQGNYDYGLMSDGYDEAPSDDKFSKDLFQNDRLDKDRFTLWIQMKGEGDFVWDQIRPMVLISILFTILILVSFGYALYFIFKQKKISQVKNDFINNMTHELKTPLASISLAAASIKHPEVIGSPEEVERFIDIIESEKNRINSHVEKVLDIASLDNGELKLNKQTADLTNIVTSAIKNVDLTLSEINGSITFIPSIENALVKVDEFHLTNVITNILDNSIKYKKEDLKITVELKKVDSNIVVSIADNGIGMTVKEQRLAFDKFYRAESGDVHNRKGFGLGLSYVKSIVEAHDGSVSMHSVVNKGTTVTLEIPEAK